MDRMRDKTAIITGGSGALGKTIALTLAREGADIAIWDISVERGQKIVDEIVGMCNRKVIFSRVDISKSKEVNAAAETVIAELGKIDVLVNNAGVVSSAPTLLDLSDERWNLELSINLTGTFYCTRAVLKHMMDKRSGKIVNIASLAGELGRPITSAGYSSSKAGVLGFTMSVARSVAAYGINVNAVCPGIIITDIHKAYSPEQLELLQADIPLNREGEMGVRGKPQDVADAVLFLASKESDYVTGTRIRVNGGSLMG
ncbi:MAG: 3-oxoacyl-ACP reductase FabG [Deltaproteobacteria bacterium]|nr:3-oxoacyl-ACP reductase FabG [Deltaproteobacteria bacterium]